MKLPNTIRINAISQAKPAICRKEAGMELKIREEYQEWLDGYQTE